MAKNAPTVEYQQVDTSDCAAVDDAYEYIFNSLMKSETKNDILESGE